MAQRSLALEVHQFYLLSFAAPVLKIGPVALYCSMNCQKGIRELSAVTPEQQKQHMMRKVMSKSLKHDHRHLSKLKNCNPVMSHL
jgi:hypothetical protein